MSLFEQQLLSTLIGTISGFILAMGLFYLTFIWKNSIEKNNLRKNMIREYEYNLRLLDTWHTNIENTITKVISNDRAIPYYFKYRDFQTIFLQAFFSRGFLYERLDDDEINSLAVMLQDFNLYGENYINGKIQDWKEGRIDIANMKGELEFERDKINDSIEKLGKIKEKIIKS